MLCRSDIAEHPPAHFDTAIPPVRPVSVVPHMPTHRNSLGNSKALLSGDRRRLVMHRQREASRTASGRAASSALAHVFEDAIGAGQAVRTADTVASQERHVKERGSLAVA